MENQVKQMQIVSFDIEETVRPLCIRVKKHLDGLRKDILTPWGEHEQEFGPT